MARLLFISHPQVVVDPTIEVQDWSLSKIGRQRAARFAGSQAFADVSTLWCSSEVKARETAEILAAPRRLPVQIDAHLGENDRSATGFLAPELFEQAADQFFAQPDVSYRGWERAVDAQTRIATAVLDIAAGHSAGDLAIVAHGAVGSLLFCQLSGVEIDRKYDQPFQGHFWCASLPTLRPQHGWRDIG